MSHSHASGGDMAWRLTHPWTWVLLTVSACHHD